MADCKMPCSLMFQKAISTFINIYSLFAQKDFVCVLSFDILSIAPWLFTYDICSKVTNYHRCIQPLRMFETNHRTLLSRGITHGRLTTIFNSIVYCSDPKKKAQHGNCKHTRGDEEEERLSLRCGCAI